jgi:hypothetical protein
MSQLLRARRNSPLNFGANRRGIGVANARCAFSGGCAMPDVRLIEAAQDPTLVPGIYNTCDQWCDYCPATSRCLAFRLSPPHGDRRDIYEDIKNAMRASMVFLKDCHEAEGLTPPEELLRLLAAAATPAAAEPVEDPLERMARRYAFMAAAFLASGDEVPRELPKRSDGPTPYEVFLYYHVLLATKIYRAIVSGRAAARTGDAGARHDADASARVALIGIDRSHEALQVMALDDGDARIEHMRRHLRQLRREVEARFPAARRLVRPGLDAAEAR